MHNILLDRNARGNWQYGYVMCYQISVIHMITCKSVVSVCHSWVYPFLCAIIRGFGGTPHRHPTQTPDPYCMPCQMIQAIISRKNQFLKKQINSKADDTWGNFLSNYAEQRLMSNVAWALFNWEWVSNFYLDILDQSFALCLTWWCIYSNISQKVAPCIISLTD